MRQVTVVPLLVAKLRAAPGIAIDRGFGTREEWVVIEEVRLRRHHTGGAVILILVSVRRCVRAANPSLARVALFVEAEKVPRVIGVGAMVPRSMPYQE